VGIFGSEGKGQSDLDDLIEVNKDFWPALS